MAQSIDFETPENIKLSYRVAGIGSRFFAWFIDNIFVTLLTIAIGFILIVVAVAADSTIDGWFKNLIDSPIDEGEVTDQEDRIRIGLILAGIFILIWGLGSFIYFFLAELMMRGQTPGKKMAKLRVVKENGFMLDAGSIFIRNIFRPIDQIPLLWIVPLVAPNSQRFGDMVGGTLVVSSAQSRMSPLRDELMELERNTATFRFSIAALERLSAEDIVTIEQFCERIGDVNEQRRQVLLAKMIPSLAQKLQVELPSAEEYQPFLRDLLAAEYRRQERCLG